MSVNESSVSPSATSKGAVDASWMPATHWARSLICMAHAWEILTPAITEDRATSLSRVPSQSGHEVKVTARSTKARRCGCRESTSLDNIDFWMRGISPS